jgi:hypothetical protein
MNLTRTAGACIAGVALAIVPLTAGPALAGGRTSASLTQASCAVQGGTFTRSKGVKTCTIPPNGYRVVEDSNLYIQRVYAPYTVSPDVISVAGLTADGYEGRWTVTNTYQDTTVLTQKGGGAITTKVTSVLVQRQNGNEECYSLIKVGADYLFSASAFPAQCAALGIYPPQIPA